MEQKQRKTIVRYFDTAKLKHKIELVKNCNFDFILSLTFSQIIWICKRQLAIAAIAKVARFALKGFVVYCEIFRKKYCQQKTFQFFPNFVNFTFLCLFPTFLEGVNFEISFKPVDFTEIPLVTSATTIYSVQATCEIAPVSVLLLRMKRLCPVKKNLTPPQPNKKLSWK